MYGLEIATFFSNIDTFLIEAYVDAYIHISISVREPNVSTLTGFTSNWYFKRDGDFLFVQMYSCL